MAKKSRKNLSSSNKQNTKIAQEKRQAKKDAVLGSEKKGRLPLMFAIACSVLIIAGGIIFATYDGSQTSPVAASVTAELSS